MIKKEEELEEEPPEKEELDWWSKYYGSLAELEKQVITDFDNGFFLNCVPLLFSSTYKCLLQEEKEDDLEDGQDGGIINAKNETNSEENIYKIALTNQTEV